MAHTIDWVLTSQTNSDQTALAKLVNRGTAKKDTGTTTGTVQFKEGVYGNQKLSDLDIKSIDSVRLFFNGYVKTTSSSRSPVFRCRKNGSTTWIDTSLSGTNTQYNKTITGSFLKASAYNLDLSMVTDSLLTSTGYTISNVFLRITYTLNSYTLAVSAGTGGTVSGGGTYESGKTATITATPSAGYRFKQWNDGNTDATRTVTVSGNITYTATFEKIDTPPQFTDIEIEYSPPLIVGEQFILRVGVT